MSTLYDLSKEGLEIFDALTDSLGELTPEFEERLDKLMLEGPQKIEAAAMAVRTLEQNAKACEEEAERLRQRAKSFDVQAGRLKQRMVAVLDTAFGGKVKTPLFSVWTQKNADRILADLIPGVTAEMLYAEAPALVRVKYELDRLECVRRFEGGDRSMPPLLVFEEKKGERSLRIK